VLCDKALRLIIRIPHEALETLAGANGAKFQRNSSMRVADVLEYPKGIGTQVGGGQVSWVQRRGEAGRDGGG
jgi:hypothetical protein